MLFRETHDHRPRQFSKSRQTNSRISNDPPNLKRSKHATNFILHPHKIQTFLTPKFSKHFQALSNYSGPGSNAYTNNVKENKLFNNGVNSDYSCYRNQLEVNSVEKLYIACDHFGLNLPVFTENENFNIYGEVSACLELDLRGTTAPKKLVLASEDLPKEPIKIKKFHKSLKPAKLSCAEAALEILNQTFKNFEEEFLKFQKEKEFLDENIYGYSKEKLLVYSEPKMSAQAAVPSSNVHQNNRMHRSNSGNQGYQPHGNNNFRGNYQNRGYVPGGGMNMNNMNMNNNFGGPSSDQSNTNSGISAIGMFPHMNSGQYKVNAYNKRENVEYNQFGRGRGGYNRGGYNNYNRNRY